MNEESRLQKLSPHLSDFSQETICKKLNIPLVYMTKLRTLQSNYQEQVNRVAEIVSHNFYNFVQYCKYFLKTLQYLSKYHILDSNNLFEYRENYEHNHSLEGVFNPIKNDQQIESTNSINLTKHLCIIFSSNCHKDNIALVIQFFIETLLNNRIDFSDLSFQDYDKIRSKLRYIESLLLDTETRQERQNRQAKLAEENIIESEQRKGRWNWGKGEQRYRYYQETETEKQNKIKLINQNLIILLQLENHYQFIILLQFLSKKQHVYGPLIKYINILKTTLHTEFQKSNWILFSKQINKVTEQMINQILRQLRSDNQEQISNNEIMEDSQSQIFSRIQFGYRQLYYQQYNEARTLKQQTKQLLTQFEITCSTNTNQSLKILNYQDQIWIMKDLEKRIELQIYQRLSNIDVQYFIKPSIKNLKRNKRQDITFIKYRLPKGQNNGSRKLINCSKEKIDWQFDRPSLYRFFNCSIEILRFLQIEGIYYTDSKQDNYIKFGSKFCLIDFDNAFLIDEKYPRAIQYLKRLIRTLLVFPQHSVGVGKYNAIAQLVFLQDTVRFQEIKKALWKKRDNLTDNKQIQKLLIKQSEKGFEILQNKWQIFNLNQVRSMLIKLLEKQSISKILNQQEINYLKYSFIYELKNRNYDAFLEKLNYVFQKYKCKETTLSENDIPQHQCIALN